MFEKYCQVMAPIIVEILKQVTANCLPMETYVVQDAVYFAVGFSHYELSNYLSFKA